MAHLAHYKEAHPLPFAVTHWVNLVGIILLIITGFMIHTGLPGHFMGVARGIHVFCGIVIGINLIVRIVLAFKVKSAPTGGTRELVPDYKMWLPQADNKHQGGAWIKYYFFAKKDHPLSAKYGVPQKITYLLIPIFIIIMVLTGLALWGPLQGSAYATAITSAVGGAMSLRIIHYFGMFLFIIFLMIHLYLVFIEGTDSAKLMLFQKESGGLVYDPEKHVIIGEDRMGGDEKA
ncbi:MAG: cytochrome b/b6 domain-containing protein [Eggerthellaceae bacterium]|jgi:Ni/Fe-hydrogenase 1 B-type cytochrome subunit